MSVWGLDISLAATGVSIGQGKQLTIDTKKADHPMQRVNVLLSVLGPLMNGLAVDVAVIEGYVIGGRRGYAAVRLAEVGGCVRHWLWQYGVPYVELNPMTLKKFATGNGKATKEQMIASAQDHGAVVRNDNEADAWWLRTFGAMGLGYSTGVEWNEFREEAINRTTWPIGPRKGGRK